MLHCVACPGCCALCARPLMQLFVLLVLRLSGLAGNAGGAIVGMGPAGHLDAMMDGLTESRCVRNFHGLV